MRKKIINSLEEFFKEYQTNRSKVSRYSLNIEEVMELHRNNGQLEAISKAYEIGFIQGMKYQQKEEA